MDGLNGDSDRHCCCGSSRNRRASSSAVWLVEQNAHMALKVASFGYVLETGRLVPGGDPPTLWGNESIRNAYLGGAPSSATA